ncbi:NAD(P)-dependent oxidoreductase [Maridesulfovibrio ferrireducens]|uniref:NAD-dependent epimerase/dehydratase family protein n=1 Tax=Maridesulfovibrio ferrireducens TaxID=246191 RepID=UPI001A30C121|nr:NAD(P)-dependent oxidoreductase [Maridesulfovibrio ferrireducens]MBI9112701.1 NAD(P)-dependent oxidoreductase [Maridesulfovibrio ferrireducens]
MITILGTTGFIGSALKARLLLDKKSVTGLSRPVFDLAKPKTYSSIPKETEILIHSAGPAGPEHAENRYWRECVQATYDLVDFINKERKNIQLIAYISSGAVYRASNSALTETSELGPSNLYGMSRLLSENIISSKANCRSVHMRLFFPYGPGQKSPRLIPELTRKIIAGEAILLNGEEGLPKLNPIYIDDLISQITSLLENTNKKVINIGGSELVTIKNLAEKIGASLNKIPVFKISNNTSSNFYTMNNKSYEENISIQNRLFAMNQQGKHND